MNLLHTLLYSGITTATTPSVKRGVILANSISLVLLSLSILAAILHGLWYEGNGITFLIPMLGILPGAVILLNYAGFVNLSRIWISIVPPLVILMLTLYAKVIGTGHQEDVAYFNARIAMLGTSVIPWVIFTLRERKNLVITSCAGLVLLVLHDPLHTVFGVPYSQDQAELYHYYFTNVVVIMSAILLIGSLIFLKWISEKNEDQNEELILAQKVINATLVEKNEEIAAQSVEIQTQSEYLSASHDKLIQANKLIEEQSQRLLTKNQSLESELLGKHADLTEINTELIKHNNELRQFSYTASHNLRGPVASLLGLINLIDGNSLREHDRQIFSYIEDSTQQLDQIIKDLNKIIDIRQDIFRIRQKIDLSSELAEIANILRSEVELQGITIKHNISACRHIYSVKPMVNSILYNLISNAIKYRSPENSPVVEINTREEGEFFVIEVCDNGLGIDLIKNKDNLFKLYKRFHHHTEGKGLGLYLTKLQCEALGGDIEVESEINRYSRFIVRLQKPANIERQVLYSEQHAEIFFDARINATGVIWMDSVTSQQYRNVFLKCLEFVHTYNTPNYISDMSRQGSVRKEDQMWMFEKILPQAIKNGLRRIAAVRADAKDPLVSQYMIGISENVRHLGAEHRFFDSLDLAIEWIGNENDGLPLPTNE